MNQVKYLSAVRSDHKCAILLVIRTTEYTITNNKNANRNIETGSEATVLENVDDSNEKKNIATSATIPAVVRNGPSSPAVLSNTVIATTTVAIRRASIENWSLAMNESGRITTKITEPTSERYSRPVS